MNWIIEISMRKSGERLLDGVLIPVYEMAYAFGQTWSRTNNWGYWYYVQNESQT